MAVRFQSTTSQSKQLYQATTLTAVTIFQNSLVCECVKKSVQSWSCWINTMLQLIIQFQNLVRYETAAPECVKKSVQSWSCWINTMLQLIIQFQNLVRYETAAPANLNILILFLCFWVLFSSVLFCISSEIAAPANLNISILFLCFWVLFSSVLFCISSSPS